MLAGAPGKHIRIEHCGSVLTHPCNIVPRQPQRLDSVTGHVFVCQEAHLGRGVDALSLEHVACIREASGDVFFDKPRILAEHIRV